MASSYIPTFEVYKGGENITARFQERATSIIVRLAAGSGDQDSCEIVLDDRGWQIATPTVGDRLEIRLGYTDVGVAYLGSFEINKVRFRFPTKTISVIGTAASSLSEIKSQKTTEYEGKTVEQILAEFGSKVGMKADVHPDIADQKIPFLNAPNLSFQALVGKLEARYNAVAKILNGRIALTPRDSGDSVSDISLPTYVFRPEHFADLEVMTESAGEYAKTTVAYRDRTTNARASVEASSKRSNNQSQAVHAIGREYPSREEAQAAADAVQAQLDRSTGKIYATLAKGDPWLRDGQRILVVESRDGIDGSYLVDLVEHRYAKNIGLTTSFSGTAGSEGLPEAYAATNADPALFLMPAPGQIIGEALKESPLILNQQNTSLPSLIGTPAPTL